ncbi:THUMP domain-containing protein 3 [Thalassophryne amazonica]|uniref:THUMP domain-containing protein 3 n=1 Tax=Thalassophryne amazonica TaxID=390379 RepID=UPI0014720686|nr:THUMP domain-containing protein 3 [Thalassophryne amazonica]XP_034022497.1 THUMP domain-containing protein 3 [Thalassophryne amazonica]XP_034022498.1 THUMP domain-containing protein 3 [Thalassophryne amazonica]
MSSHEDGPVDQDPVAAELPPSSSIENNATTEPVITVTIGATVPTGFEPTAVEEVMEKIGVDARISTERGRIYFAISTDKLSQVHLLKSVDNLFVVVDEYHNYPFKESKEETLMELQQLASKLPWTNALEVWKLNCMLKKKKRPRKGGKVKNVKPNGEGTSVTEDDVEQQESSQASSSEDQTKEEDAPDIETSAQNNENTPSETKPIKFRVTCSRAGDKHNFSSSEAARDFGGAVQQFFQWKADMTKFDVEVLLNIHNEEVVIGIALTEESLHRRNITHFGPTTLRSTLCYGMLRLCQPQESDIIFDPMCGTGAIPLEGALEFRNSFFIAGDNNDVAINRTVSNICHIQKRMADKGGVYGLPIDTVRWDLCHLPIRTSSVDVIISDMPFGKRMGSKKKNWNLYPSCLREMARVSRPGSGRAVLLTQDKKCFAMVLSRMGGLWRRTRTVWVNVGGLHAGVYLLKRTAEMFVKIPENVHESRHTVNKDLDEKHDADGC